MDQRKRRPNDDRLPEERLAALQRVRRNLFPGDRTPSPPPIRRPVVSPGAPVALRRFITARRRAASSTPVRGNVAASSTTPRRAHGSSQRIPALRQLSAAHQHKLRKLYRESSSQLSQYSPETQRVGCELAFRRSPPLVSGRTIKSIPRDKHTKYSIHKYEKWREEKRRNGRKWVD